MTSVGFEPPTSDPVTRHETSICNIFLMLPMIAFIVAVLLYPVLSVTPPTVTWIGLLPEENATTYVNAMPIGNGALAANVIVDNKNASNPIIALLISDQRSWNEAGEFIKVGKVTLELTPNPWGTADTTSIKQVGSDLTNSFSIVTCSAGSQYLYRKCYS